MSVSQDPAINGQAVSTSDTVNLNRPSRGIYVGSTGTVIAVMHDGSTLSFVNCPDGLIIPIQAIRINATGTTATNIVALF